MLAHHDHVLRAYLHGKDASRPHLFGEAFAPDATFQTTFAFETDWHAPEPVHGLPAITDTFRRLGAGFENIWTFCLPETVRWTEQELAMRWVVLMTARDTGAMRLAWGDYRWRFTDDSHRATSLHVHMHAMRMLPRDQAAPLLDWAAELPEVWCHGSDAAETLPEGAVGLAEFLLARDAA